jgi:hypothetical protein
VKPTYPARLHQRFFLSNGEWRNVAVFGFCWMSILLVGCQRASSPKHPPVPEMAGAMSAAFHLGSSTTNTSLAMQAPMGRSLWRQETMPRRVFLRFENITSNAGAPDYDVYLNIPPNENTEKHRELLAGRLPMFGLIEASMPDETLTVKGLYHTLDVTLLYARLPTLPGWDARNLRLSFVPTRLDVAADVRVGRIKLYFE